MAKSGKSPICAVEICLRCAYRERNLDYFLNPSTIPCTQLGAVATGSSQLMLSFATDFSQGLSERITQLEVILFFI